jgi:hypothetical protein
MPSAIIELQLVIEILKTVQAMGLCCFGRVGIFHHFFVLDTVGVIKLLQFIFCAKCNALTFFVLSSN